MNMLISGGRVIDPTSGFDEIADVALVNAEVVAIKNIASDFRADQVIDARGCIVAPGLVDLAVRLREPGHEHARMLQSELAAAVAGGVTRLVCPPDTDPVLDEPGLVEMLRHRAEKLQLAQVHPLGALTRNLGGETLTEMVALSEAGCVAFSTPAPLTTRYGCGRKTITWAAAWPPAVRWPPAWAWPGCRWRRRPSPCTPFSS